jgi:hypothetical protein
VERSAALGDKLQRSDLKNEVGGGRGENKDRNWKIYVIQCGQTRSVIGSVGLASSTANQSHAKQCDGLIGEQNIAAMSHTRTSERRIRDGNVNGRDITEREERT